MNTSLPSYFSSVTDPRVVGRCSHLLSDILLIGLCTYLTGGSDYEDMRLFAKERGSELGSLLSLPNGVPSVDTFERVYKAINPDELVSCLQMYGKDILNDLSEKQIVIDGKKLRGVSPTTRGNTGLFLLNAWVSENRFCLFQEKVEDKSNEKTAIPHALDRIDIKDTVVSIDAMGTEKSIAEQIIEKEGNYLLSLKGNQKSLLEDVECAFKVHKGHDVFESIEKDHGRIETRICSILPAVEYLMEENFSEWKELKTIIRVDTTREVKGKISSDTRYYISNESISTATYYNSLIRGHWSIENQLHWHLDVTFKEDQCRARIGYAAQNLSVLRKLALHLVSQQKDKLSMKKKLYKAALDIEYLKLLLKI